MTTECAHENVKHLMLEQTTECVDCSQVRTDLDELNGAPFHPKRELTQAEKMENASLALVARIIGDIRRRGDG